MRESDIVPGQTRSCGEITKFHVMTREISAPHRIAFGATTYCTTLAVSLTACEFTQLAMFLVRRCSSYDDGD